MDWEFSKTGSRFSTSIEIQRIQKNELHRKSEKHSIKPSWADLVTLPLAAATV